MKPLKRIVIHHTTTQDDVQKEIIDQSHKDRGYSESFYGSHIAYHILIEEDGSVIHNRSLSERTGHTRNIIVNQESIAIALEGNFNQHKPSRHQLLSLKRTIESLTSVYPIEIVQSHGTASPTACPGEHLWKWIKENYPEPPKRTLFSISRYYTPTKGQREYYHGSYEKDFEINCMGDCFSTASRVRLEDKEPFTVAACPPSYDFGTKIDLEGIGTVVCLDRGGAIKGNRIDIWSGYGDAGLFNVKNGRVQGGVYYGTVIDK